MSDVKHAHPSSEQLAAFKEGRLSKAAVVALQAHLEMCAACRERVETTIVLTGRPPDTDSRNLQEAATVAPGVPAPAEPVRVPAALAEHPRYRIQELLGTGGMGSVYKAEHRMMERLVALKVISPSLIANPDAVQRFHLEVKAAARLSHPNIVTAFDADQAGHLHFLVMEFVEGLSLAQVIEKRGPLPIAHACEYIRQTALGLQHAFEQGMVHRDIKPQNLMLTPKGRVKILDFGLARFASETSKAGLTRDTVSAPNSRLTLAGSIVGTPDYIAPEQVTDAHTADIRADIYSLGCTFYDLLTGRPPFPEGNTLQKMMAHIEESPCPVRTLRQEVSLELVCVLGRMMAKDPAERYQTPGEVARALAPFVKSALASGQETERTGEHAPVRSSPLLTPVPAIGKDTPPGAANEDERLGADRPRRRRRRTAPHRARHPWLIPGLGIGLLLVVIGLIAGKKMFSAREIGAVPPNASVMRPSVSVPEHWKKFTSKEGGFSVYFPSANLREVTLPLPLVNGEKKGVGALLPNDQGLYTVFYSELPAAVIQQPGDADRILDIIPIQVRGQGAKVLGEMKKISLDGYPGREVSLEAAGKELSALIRAIFPGREAALEIAGKGFVLFRIYLVKSRQYELVAVGTKERISSQETEAFLDSFQLTGKKVFLPKERADSPPSTNVSQPPSKPPEGWTELASQEGGFRVLFPSATPVHEKKTVPTQIGPLQLHIISVELPNKQGLYSVIYNELPFVTNPQDNRPIEPVVQNIKAYFQGARVIGEPKRIRLEGYPGLELNLEQSVAGPLIPVAGTLIMRIYWVKNRQYQIITGGRLTFTDNQRFFESFKLLSR
jgi:serine/threonine protein kinase